MAIPAGNSYSAASGATIYGGRAAPVLPSTLPLWLQGAGLNEWMAIANTSGADGQKLDAWCGFAIKQSTGEIILPLCGGHDDDWRTRVSSITVTDDAPSWLVPPRKESITFDQANYSTAEQAYPYCTDGTTPSSRHTRYSSLYCAQNDRLMMIGSPSLYGNNATGHSNGFSLVTNEWDPPGTYPTGPAGLRGTCIDDLGNVWARSYKWDRVTNALLPYPAARSTTSDICAFDPVRRQLFDLAMGNGQGFSLNLGIVARTISEDLTTVRTITFNPSAEYDEFVSLTLDYSAVEYDPLHDQFLYYYGKGISQGVVYVITPNEGTVWDVAKLVQGPNTALPPAPSSAGTNARFKYVELLKGVVLLPRQSSNIYFMRLG